MYEVYQQFAQGLAKKGGQLLQKNFGKLKEDQIEFKGVHDVVTKLDKEVEKMYVEEIHKSYPDHGIIGEEGGSENPENEFVWVLDPLDGTRNYTREVPFYATTICLLKNKEPIIALIYCPVVNKMYHAIKNQGAYLNGKSIHVSKTDQLLKSAILYCHKPEKEAIKNAEKYAVKLKIAAKEADRLRSAGCEMGMVAEGLSEAYLLDGLPLWDLAGGSLLIREAGGKVTDFNGKEWKPGDNNILLSNGTKIHEEVLNILK